MELTSACVYLLQTIVCLILIQHQVDSNRENVRPGRHVCTRREHVTVPVHTRISSLRPMYRRHAKYCQDDPNRICTEYRLEYQKAFRSVVRMEVQTRNAMTCCPGWTQYSPAKHTCMKAVCTKPCKNGGECTEPDRCKCPDGWTGKTCGQDVNECATGGDDCQQKCINTKGSFHCACYDGFRSSPDMKTCELCLSCSEEYQALLNGYASMAEKVVKLEKEKDLLMRNMSTVQNDMHFMADQMFRYSETTAHEEAKTTTTAAPTTSKSIYDEYGYSDQFGGYSPLERISSLSEQISMLEERLDVCTCESKK